MEMKKRERVMWVDIAKGIAILCVIAGHTWTGGLLGEYAQLGLYSFHMPIFFILSGVTFSVAMDWCTLGKKSGKTFLHLIWPAALILLGTTILNGFPFAFDWTRPFHSLGRVALLLVFPGNGAAFPFGTLEMPLAGIPWFFIALWSGRLVYEVMSMIVADRWHLLVSCLLSVVGYALFGYCRLPFMMELSLAIQPFFAVGQIIKRHRERPFPWWSVVVSGFVWAALLAVTVLTGRGRLAFPGHQFPLYPFCFITAIAGSLAIFGVSQWLGRCSPKLTAAFAYLGRMSLYLLIIHALDGVTKGIWLHCGPACLILRIAVDVSILLMVHFFIRKVSGIWTGKSI